MLFHNMYASTSYKIQQKIISDVGNVYFLSYCFNWHVGFQEYNIAAHSQKNPWLPGMSIDFEVAGENWKVAGKLMRTAQPSATHPLRGKIRLECDYFFSSRYQIYYKFIFTAVMVFILW
jgi:hypothetical protein